MNSGSLHRPKPLFVLSLPRSGSTLLQRLIAAHPAVDTASETWLALAPIYATRSDGLFAEYDQATAARAVNIVIDRIGGEEVYYAAVSDFLSGLYTRMSSADTAIFLDKTPRYHLIIEELFQVFPDAKFIFLWRNPLAAAASMVQTWGDGWWNLYRFDIDLFQGLNRLVGAYEAHREGALAVRYEDLVADTVGTMRRVFEYLDVPPDDGVTQRFHQFDFDLGDTKGASSRQVYSTGVTAWSATFAGPLRRRWARRYLEWLGAERLTAMGYEHDEIRRTLDVAPSVFRTLGSDAARMGYGVLYRSLRRLIVHPDRRDAVRRLAAVRPSTRESDGGRRDVQA